MLWWTPYPVQWTPSPVHVTIYHPISFPIPSLSLEDVAVLKMTRFASSHLRTAACMSAILVTLTCWPSHLHQDRGRHGQLACEAVLLSGEILR